MSIDHGVSGRLQPIEGLRLTAGNDSPNLSESIQKNKITLYAIVGGVACGIIAAIALGILFGPYAASIGLLCGALIGVCIGIVANCCMPKAPLLSEENAMSPRLKGVAGLESARKEMNEALSLWPSQVSDEEIAEAAAEKEMDEVMRQVCQASKEEMAEAAAESEMDEVMRQVRLSQASNGSATLESACREMDEAMNLLCPSQVSRDGVTLESACEEMDEVMSQLSSGVSEEMGEAAAEKEMDEVMNSIKDQKK